MFSNNFSPQKLGFWKVSQGPGGFRKLREACRIRFHLSWYLSNSMVPSYDQNAKKLTTKKVTTHGSLEKRD